MASRSIYFHARNYELRRRQEEKIARTLAVKDGGDYAIEDTRTSEKLLWKERMIILEG